MNPFRHSLRSKFLSVFVLAFLCLNVGAGACLAYCGGWFSAVSGEDEHCPLAKLSPENCPMNKSRSETDSFSKGVPVMDCCALPLNFVFAPLEKNNFVFHAPFAKRIIAGAPKFEIQRQFGLNTEFSYHSPPLDSRIERIKYGVFLI